MRGAPLAVLPRPGGSPVATLEAAYQPLLVDWTDEDAAAKGLRRGVTERPPPVHHTALERAAAEPMLLLTGAAGSGRTTFLRHLALQLARQVTGNAADDDAARPPMPRGPDGTLREEAWTGPVPVPLLLEEGGSFEDRLAAAGPEAAALLRDARAGALSRPVLLLLDAADRMGEGWAGTLLSLAAPGLRVVATSDGDTVPGLPGLRRHALLPFLPAQRAAFRDALAARFGTLPETVELPGLPGRLALAAVIGGDDPGEVAERFAAALRTASGVPEPLRAPIERMIRPHLLAHALADAPDPVAAARDAGRVGDAALRLLAAVRPDRAAGMAEALLRGASDDAALLAAELLRHAPAAAATRSRAAAALLRAIADDRLTPARRAAAGQYLAALGDPRDLEELVAIPAGRFTMGSDVWPNAAPPHPVVLPAFRIGRHPVTNAAYARFADRTGRPWPTANGRDAARANHPATDVTWRDAHAYCAWIAPLWRDAGRIGRDDRVRLPTEAEWERAARGPDRDAPGPDAPGLPWRPHRANDEAAGLNEPVAVGLFPAGRTVEGCDDLHGNVWEWCSTLWGEDMAHPAFAYPYDPDDGRENPDAAPDVRRILRGGCFSSAPDKAGATYRGALEPDGFWRGNGFRVVVAPGARGAT